MKNVELTTEKGKLTRHTQSLHDRIKDHVCGECESTISGKSDLKKHIQGVHDKIKDHMCGECDAAF